MTSADPEVVRWYTAARRFPQLIGRTADGARLWGGPYTVAQVLGGAGMLAVAALTSSTWARWGALTNVTVLAAATAGVVWLLGRIPPGARNPLSVASGGWQAVSAPRWGRLRGRPVRPARPHRLRHRMTLATPPPPSPRPDPARPSRRGRPLPPPPTAVQALLVEEAR